VPDHGSRPYVAADDPIPRAAAHEQADWSFMDGDPTGITLFVGGLVGLVVAIGGLITVALRRRD
jgi:hypothetical protein